MREVLERGGDDLVVVIAYTRAVGKVDPARWRAFLRDELKTDPEQVMGAAENLQGIVERIFAAQSLQEALGER